MTIKISENQLDFMSGRLITETIHLLKRLTELYKDKKKDLHMVFIDIKKAYGRVLWGVLCRYFEKKRVPAAYIRVFKDTYEGVTSVRTPRGDTNDFPVDIRPHQGFVHYDYG